MKMMALLLTFNLHSPTSTYQCQSVIEKGWLLVSGVRMITSWGQLLGNYARIQFYCSLPALAWHLQTFYLSRGVSLWNDTTNKNLNLTSSDKFINPNLYGGRALSLPIAFMKKNFYFTFLDTLHTQKDFFALLGQK